MSFGEHECAVNFFVILARTYSVPCRWEPASEHHIPSRAFIATMSPMREPVYVGRAMFGRELLPAGVTQRDGATVSYAGRAHTLQNYEVRTLYCFIHHILPVWLRFYLRNKM